MIAKKRNLIPAFVANTNNFMIHDCIANKWTKATEHNTISDHGRANRTIHGSTILWGSRTFLSSYDALFSSTRE